MTIASELTLLNNTKTAIAAAIEDKGVTVGTIPFSQYPAKIAEISGGGGEVEAWVRNPSWLPLPTVTDTESKFVGLHAVWPEANFLALSATGNYTVDWGDGVTENFSSGVVAYHIYDFADADLDNTNAPLTFTASTSVVNRTAHGYNNGDTLSFDSITTTTGIVAGQIYYIVNKTADTFQLSATEGGTALTLTNDGTGIILPYKQAVVTVTPQAGATFTNINLNRKHNQTALQTYASGWLDVLISGPSLTSLQIQGNTSSSFVLHTNLEQAQLISSNNIASFSNVFNGCRKLQSLPIWQVRTSGAVNMSGMFSSCSSLQTVPALVTSAVTNMFQMFLSCNSLQTVPLFNTAAVTSMNQMFSGCSSLQTIPLFNTAAVTAMNSMFSGCSRLQTVPALVTSAVTSATNFNSMFSNCNSLTRIEAKDFRWTFSVANCKLSDVRLKEIFTNLPRVTTSQTLTVTGNYGIGTITSKASLSLTAGSTTISMADTSGVVNGMFVTGTGTAINTDVSVTSDVTLDTLTKTAHGLSNGDKISFSALSTTTGVLTWTIYYVVNKTDNDFQIALTEGGSPIDLTGSNATMSIRYPSFVTNVVTNTSVEISTPLASTGTQTLTFRQLDSSEALLKNWAVTF